ncbi:hypothetical protein ACQ4LE_001889 [Meloidogyne hapla]
MLFIKTNLLFFIILISTQYEVNGMHNPNEFVRDMPDLDQLAAEYYVQSTFPKFGADISYENHQTIGLYVPLLFTVDKVSGASSSHAREGSGN